jgi:acetyltransferase-like isoleucine patch superfamily enzyme
MNWLLHTVNVMNSVLPSRESFGIRRMLANRGGIVVGKGTRITHGVKFYDRYITIGNSVFLGTGTILYSTDKGRITIEDNVDIAPCCRIVSGTHEIGSSERRAGPGAGQDIVIGRGTWIGVGTSILAAGSVVIAGEYPPNTLLAGVPASIKRVLP